MNKKEEFLKELTDLSIKYGIIIQGCGCCGSPFLSSRVLLKLNGRYKTDDDQGSEYADNLTFEEDSNNL